jgi:hypothetical protein
MMRHQEQLLYDGVTSCRGEIASGGNDSTMMRHQEQLLYDDVTYRRGETTFRGNDSMMMRHQEHLLMCMMTLPLIDAKLPSMVYNLPCFLSAKMVLYDGI